MIFHDKYELLALRGDDRELALPGKEISSGRDVLVHLLAGGYTPENRDVLTGIDNLPAEYRLRVLDKGDHDGIPYVVTEVLSPNLKLREWLSAARSAVSAPKPPTSPGRSGAWRIPADTEPTKVRASAAQEPGEFTRLSRAAREPEQVRQPDVKPEDLPVVALATSKPNQPAAEMHATQQPSLVGGPEPGEFTRLLRAAAPRPPEVAPAATPAAVSPEPELSVAPPAAATALEPGEFTRILRAAAPPTPEIAPAATPAAVPPPPVGTPAEAPPAAANAPEPGEFTGILRAAAPPTPEVTPTATPAAVPAPPVGTPAEAPPAAATAPEPGEFTRILRAAAPPTPEATPTATPAAVPPPPVGTPAEAPPAAATAPEPGEFTRMFQASTPATPDPKRASPSPPPSLPRVSAPGEFTRMMQSPLAAEPLRSQPAATPPQSASEFTRMMRAGKLNDATLPEVSLPGPAATSPPPGRSPQTPGEFTRMFATEPAASGNLAMPAASQAPLPQGGLATGAFSGRAVSTPPPVASGPSEFTQMFAAPPPADAAMASAPKPAPPAPKAEKSSLVLILVLAGLFLLIVIVIVVFALTR